MPNVKPSRMPARLRVFTFFVSSTIQPPLPLPTGSTRKEVASRRSLVCIRIYLTSLPSQSLIVYDLGGGTLDVSLLSIDGGEVQVLATAGCPHLGGEDFDNRVIDALVDVYKLKPGVNVAKDSSAIAKLKLEVEKAKCTLSSEEKTRVYIKDFQGGKDFSETLTRAMFEEVNMDLFRKTMKPVQQVLSDTNIRREDINDVGFRTRYCPTNILFYLGRSRWWLHAYPQNPTAT